MNLTSALKPFRLSIKKVITFLIIGLSAATLAACSGGDDPAESDTTAPTRAVGIDPGRPTTTAASNSSAQASVGSCFVRIIGDSFVGPVPCTEPHQIEVYAIPQAPATAGEFDSVQDEVANLCAEQFAIQAAAGVGLPTVFAQRALAPLGKAWDEGDRNVACYVEYPSPIEFELSKISPFRGFNKVSLYGLQSKDCLNGFSPDTAIYDVVACGEPHNAEVMLSLDYDPGGFPGEERVETDRENSCKGEGFETFVGKPSAESSLKVFISSPNPQTWDLGDRRISCVLTKSDGSDITGSLEGSQT